MKLNNILFSQIYMFILTEVLASLFLTLFFGVLLEMIRHFLSLLKLIYLFLAKTKFLIDYFVLNITVLYLFDFTVLAQLKRVEILFALPWVFVGRASRYYPLWFARVCLLWAPRGVYSTPRHQIREAPSLLGIVNICECFHFI